MAAADAKAPEVPATSASSATAMVTGAQLTIENMSHGVHSTQAVDVSAADIGWNDSADEFHHSVGDSGQSPDGLTVSKVYLMSAAE